MEQIFIHLEPKINVIPNQDIKIRDIASILCESTEIEEKILNIVIHKSSNNTKSEVIPVLKIVKRVKEEIKNSELIVFGGPEILINISDNKDINPIFEFIKIFMVSIILFLGAALAIINFHEDVSIEMSFKTFYKIITGNESERPLIIEIPYSLGLGLGMGVFFNHMVKKKWKKEPSPLEVEMHMYSKNIDEYVLDTTKHNNSKNSGEY